MTKPELNPDQHFYDFDDYMALPRDPTPWVIENLIPLKGLVNLFGVPKAGKSFAALGMAYAIANPEVPYWLDPSFKVTKHGRVMYLQIDTPRPAWHQRLDLIKAKHGWSAPKSMLQFSDSSSSPYPFDILNVFNYAWFRKQCSDIEPDVVFIDTLREVHGGDEDSSTAMRNVIARLVAAVQPAAMVLVSHSRKGNNDRNGKGSDDIMDANRGSGYVAGRMDMVARLTDHNFYTKGRAAMDAKFAIKQETGTGLLIPDYEVGDIEMGEVMKAAAMVDVKNPMDRVRLLKVMYPDASAESIRKKLGRMKGMTELPDPKKMKYTMADIEMMVQRVVEKKHPTKDEPLPLVNLMEPAKKAKGKKDEEE